MLSLTHGLHAPLEQTLTFALVVLVSLGQRCALALVFKALHGVRCGGQ